MTRGTGTIDLGLGDPFMALTDGQEANYELGLQGLYMFVINARVHGLDLGIEDERGAVRFASFAPSGEQMSLEFGCRARDFNPDDGNGQQLATTFFLPFDPTFTPTLDGTTVTIRAEVIDHTGATATTERTVVARPMPR